MNNNQIYLIIKLIFKNSKLGDILNIYIFVKNVKLFIQWTLRLWTNIINIRIVG